MALREGSISFLCPSEFAVGEKALDMCEKIMVLKKKSVVGLESGSWNGFPLPDPILGVWVEPYLHLEKNL